MIFPPDYLELYKTIHAMKYFIIFVKPILQNKDIQLFIYIKTLLMCILLLPAILFNLVS